LWWAPKQSQVEIPNESVKYRNVRAKVGSLANIEYRPRGGQVSIRDEPVQWQASSRVNSLSNTNWLPSTPRVSVHQEKLKWNAQSKVNSLDNVNYKPGGGRVEIYDEKLDFNYVSPRVNCGFVD
jgi:hypothetical protein